MLTTEKDAKTRWCPMQDCNCIASGCMMWTWDRGARRLTAHGLDRERNGLPLDNESLHRISAETYGYCGLAEKH